MNEFVKQVQEQIDQLGLTPTGNHISTPQIREVSAKMFRTLSDKDIVHIFPLCEAMLMEDTLPMKVIAFDFAYRLRKQYDEQTFSVFEQWLMNYIIDWGDCEDFCTHAFRELLLQRPELFQRILPWTNHQKFAVRRAAAVI